MNKCTKYIFYICSGVSFCWALLDVIAVTKLGKYDKKMGKLACMNHDMHMTWS